MNNVPWVFIDASYVIYYTAFSSWNWYKREFTPRLTADKSYEVENDMEYLAMFKSCFKRELVKVLTNKVGIFDHKKVVFCIDCPRKDIWRKSYYAAYKLNRDNKDLPEFNIGSAFQYAKNIIIPEMKDILKCQILESSNAEGDDLIAIAVETLSKNHSCVIISCDYDLIQLINDNVTIYNLQSMDLNLERITEKYGVNTISDYLKLKIIMGDAGDNIPAIHDRCGKSKALKYLTNPKLLMENKHDIDMIKQNLKRNKLLIDFKSIPPEIVEAIRQKVEQIEIGD